MCGFEDPLSWTSLTAEAVTGLVVGFTLFLVWWQYTYNVQLTALVDVLVAIRLAFSLLNGGIADVFPGSAYDLDKVLDPIAKDLYMSLVVCPKCSATYNEADAKLFDLKGDCIGTKTCSAVSKGQLCGESLSEKKTSGEWRPRKLYHYVPLYSSLPAH